MEDNPYIHLWIFYTTMRYDRVLLENHKGCKVRLKSTLDRTRSHRFAHVRVCKIAGKQRQKM